jgi:hypothetical protein
MGLLRQMGFKGKGRYSMLHKTKLFQSFFILLITIVVFIGSSIMPFSELPLATASGADHLTLTWERDPKITQTITWRTAVTDQAGKVRYAETLASRPFPKNAQIAAAGVEELSTNVGNMNIHSVTLTGLKPGTRYTYQVSDGDGWSESHTFTTAAVKVPKFKFLVFGDSQCINYEAWETTLHQAYQANLDAAFFTNMGDLVDVGQDYAHWDKWFSAAQGVIDTIPAMPLTGNHENYTPERRFSMPILFTAQFKVPLNGPESLKRQAYSFDYGDVHFIVLDSQAGEQAQFVPAMLEVQKAWLEQDLAATDKKWKVVFLHRPPYHNKMGGANKNVKMAFVPILDKYHVDVAFTAHEHAYARTYPLYNNQVADSPDEGTIYVATGRSGTKTYKDTAINEWDAFFYNPLDEPNYLVVEIEGNILSVRTYKQSGVLVDDWSIKKAITLKKGP